MQNSVSSDGVEVNGKLRYHLKHLYPLGHPHFSRDLERSYSKNYWFIHALSRASNTVFYFYKFYPSSLK